jgi:hypothetical protein
MITFFIFRIWDKRFFGGKINYVLSPVLLVIIISMRRKRCQGSLAKYVNTQMAVKEKNTIFTQWFQRYGCTQIYKRFQLRQYTYKAFFIWVFRRIPIFICNRGLKSILNSELGWKFRAQFFKQNSTPEQEKPDLS